MPRRAALLPAVALLLTGASASPPAASARDGDGRSEVRVRGHCGTGATSALRLKADDGRLEVRFTVDHDRAGTPWRVTIVRERRVVLRTRARTSTSGGAFTVRRRLTDLSGADVVTARAVGPRGLTCEASATLPGRR